MLSHWHNVKTGIYRCSNSKLAVWWHLGLRRCIRSVAIVQCQSAPLSMNMSKSMSKEGLVYLHCSMQWPCDDLRINQILIIFHGYQPEKKLQSAAISSIAISKRNTKLFFFFQQWERVSPLEGWSVLDEKGVLDLWPGPGDSPIGLTIVEFIHSRRHSSSHRLFLLPFTIRFKRIQFSCSELVRVMIWIWNSFGIANINHTVHVTRYASGAEGP